MLYMETGRRNTILTDSSYVIEQNRTEQNRQFIRLIHKYIVFNAYNHK